MQAEVTIPFTGAADGETRSRRFVPGDVIRGDLARVAVDEGWAKALGAAPERQALEALPENKALGGAPVPFQSQAARAAGRRRGDRAKS